MCKADIKAPRALTIITLRRELGSRYARLTRRWLAARSAYRRLHQRPVANLAELRQAAERIATLERGRAALLSDLKALSV